MSLSFGDFHITLFLSATAATMASLPATMRQHPATEKVRFENSKVP